MSTSDVDSDSFSEIEPLDLDDDVIALLDGRASSEAGHPTTSSDFDTSYCNDKRSALKQEPSSPALAPQVDEDGFPLMTLTQEETAVLDALEEKYQLSQLSVPLSRNSSDDFVSQPLTQLRGKRRRPLPTGQSLTQPTRSSGSTSLAFVSSGNNFFCSIFMDLRSQNIGNVTCNQPQHSMKAESRDTTATVPLKTKTAPSIPIGKKVKIESKDMIEIPSSDEEEQQVTARRSVLVNDRSNGRVTKRRKVDISSKSKVLALCINQCSACSIVLQTQPTAKSVSMTQPLPARSYSISAMVALWDDVDQIEPDVIEISSDSEPEPQPEALAKVSSMVSEDHDKLITLTINRAARLRLSLAIPPLLLSPSLTPKPYALMRFSHSIPNSIISLMLPLSGSSCDSAK